jgi:hypothetical protein
MNEEYIIPLFIVAIIIIFFIAAYNSNNSYYYDERFVGNLEGVESPDGDLYGYYYDTPHPPDSWFANAGLLPWWNSTRHTRNMSYDLRGDVPIYNITSVPFYQSPLIY